MYYLAYGSNMANARLKKRIPSAQKVGLVTLTGHRLTFANGSTIDGSGKCDALLTDNPADLVYAVLYRMDDEEKETLDGYEGLGVEYRDDFLEIELPDGRNSRALIYYATNLNPELKPYHWYKQHVLYGAQENRLPEKYISAIRNVESVGDPDQQRAERELAIYK